MFRGGHFKARSVGSLGGAGWIPQLLVVTGQMEIPLQQGNALCWAYNGLFIYIFWPQGLGSSGSEAYTHFCGMWFALHELRLVLNPDTDTWL